MQIRPIQVSDIERFTELWNRVYAEGKYLRSPAPDKDTLTNILRRVELELIPQFVALDNHVLIGSVEIFPAELCGYEGCQLTSTGILGIHIDRTFRGKGLGKQLLSVALKSAWEYGYDTIVLNVYKDNLAAIALYERFGFEHHGELGEVTLPNGEVLMSQKMMLSAPNNPQ